MKTGSCPSKMERNKRKEAAERDARARADERRSTKDRNRETPFESVEGRTGARGVERERPRLGRKSSLSRRLFFNLFVFLSVMDGRMSVRQLNFVAFWWQTWSSDLVVLTFSLSYCFVLATKAIFVEV